MKSVSLTAYPRTAHRRNALGPLRNSGRIPAVIYGAGGTPQSLELVAKDLDTVLHHHVSEALLVDLKVDSDARPQRLALLQEIQHHPLSRKVVHVDFHEVSANEPVTVSIPVQATGEAVGVKTGGGVLEHVLHKLRVRALPKDLPEVIVVDVSALEIGKAIHIGELTLPAGVEILGNKDFVVLACAAPKTEEEAAAEEATPEAGTPEVEMIKEKKEEGGEEKGAAKDAKAPAKDTKAPAKDAKAPAKEGEKK
jgi:large subunit ribosomal protein L25